MRKYLGLILCYTKIEQNIWIAFLKSTHSEKHPVPIVYIVHNLKCYTVK